MKGIFRRASLVTVAALIAGLVVGIAPGANAQAADPFASPTAFCQKHSAPPGKRNSSSPGVSPNSINLADLSLDTVAFRAFGLNLPDFHGYFQAFVDEINSCGGINGRKLNMKYAKSNGLAPDFVSYAQTMCLKVTEDWKTFIAVGIGALSAGLPQCLAVQHKTIYAANAGVTSAEFANSKGRLVSPGPSIDGLSKMFLNYGLKRNLFKGRKVAVVGLSVIGTAQELKDAYIEPLAKAGIDATLEVAPCIGSNCKAQLGAIVSRLKAKGIDLIVIDRWALGSMGTFQKAMAEQRLDARLVGPFVPGVHNDTGTTGAFPDSGAAGAAWSSANGFLGVVATESDMSGAYRVGIKATPFAQMCQDVVARRLKQNKYVLANEADNKSGHWGTVVTACSTIRGIAKAIYSVGNNVTTERVASALAKVTIDQRYQMAPFSNTGFYSGKNVVPTKIVELGFNYPCTLALNPAGTACFTPKDRPVRVRSL
jgi:hypothetical protein